MTVVLYCILKPAREQTLRLRLIVRGLLINSVFVVWTTLTCKVHGYTAKFRTTCVTHGRRTCGLLNLVPCTAQCTSQREVQWYCTIGKFGDFFSLYIGKYCTFVCGTLFPGI